jgi:prophage antirepressor-like protein
MDSKKILSLLGWVTDEVLNAIQSNCNYVNCEYTYLNKFKKTQTSILKNLTGISLQQDSAKPHIGPETLQKEFD